MPPISSCAWKVSAYAPKVSTAPMPSARTIARPDAHPQPRQHIAAPEARQVCDEDADDERGFEAFAQADEEGGEHVGPIGSGVGSEVRLT